MSLTNKQQVLQAMYETEGLASRIAKAVPAIPKDSVRHILNELKNEGLIRKDRASGTWGLNKQGLAASEALQGFKPVAPVPVVKEAADAVVEPEGVDLPNDLEVEVAPLVFKFEAEGDTVYIQGETEDAAWGVFNEYLGVPRELVTISQVDALPEGEELLNAPDEGIAHLDAYDGGDADSDE